MLAFLCYKIDRVVVEGWEQTGQALLSTTMHDFELGSWRQVCRKAKVLVLAYESVLLTIQQPTASYQPPADSGTTHHPHGPLPTHHHRLSLTTYSWRATPLSFWSLCSVASTRYLYCVPTTRSYPARHLEM